MRPRPHISTLFPYTTLFRSQGFHSPARRDDCHETKEGRRSDRRQDHDGRIRIGLPRLSVREDRKSTRLNSSHTVISYAVFCLKKKNNKTNKPHTTRVKRKHE